MVSRIDLELLAQGKLDEGLILATSEECEDAAKDRERESRCGPHRGRILVESSARLKTESGSAVRLPFEDEQGHLGKTTSRINTDGI